MKPKEIAILLKAVTDMVMMLKSNGITEADLDGAIQKEEARRKKLLAQI